jgi:hypothetical protein
MKSIARFALVTVALLSLNSCGGGGGGGGGGDRPISAGAVELSVANSPATNGIFDAAPMADGSGNLWMSYSAVTTSPNDPSLGQVFTRIASSTNAGNTWTDIGTDPTGMASNLDFQVGGIWVTWRYEVSRLLYDPYDADSNRRWKILWHRYATMAGNIRLFQNGWIGLSTASVPDGAWNTERNLFTGTLYNAAEMNAIIGAPEFPLAADFSSASELGNCTAFTEPGMLARADGIYVSLQCTGAGKIVLLKCDHAFGTCDYLGDLLTDSEAAQFSLSGQSLDGFAASELVDVGTSTYLLVTGFETIGSDNQYRGCLVFRVSDLNTATLERSGGEPVLVKRVAGTAGSFNGACGYHAGATGSGVIYSEYSTSAPQFRLYGSHIQLP